MEARFTILGANFRLRHLTFSANSRPHVLDVLARIFENDAVYRLSIGAASTAHGGLKWLPFTASLLQYISISPTLRCKRSLTTATSRSKCFQWCFCEWSGSLYKNWQRCSQLLISRIKPPLDTEHERQVDIYVIVALWQFIGLEATDISKTSLQVMNMSDCSRSNIWSTHLVKQKWALGGIFLVVSPYLMEAPDHDSALSFLASSRNNDEVLMWVR